MASRQAILASMLAIPTILAQSTSIVTLQLPNFDPQPIEGSVIQVGPSATSYFLACPTGEDSADCGLGPGINALVGPSTFEMHLTQSPFTDDVSCVISADSATCTQVATNSGSADTSSFQVTAPGIPVTLTAGLQLLASAGASASTTPASSTNGGIGSTSTTKGTTGTTQVGAATGSTSTGTSRTGASSGTSKGGVPRATQNAVLAGVAAVVGGVLAL